METEDPWDDFDLNCSEDEEEQEEVPSPPSHPITLAPAEQEPNTPALELAP